MVELRISDDGRGIDPDKVKASAIKSGLISAADGSRLNPLEALKLIFKSSLSTSAMITEISGRGLGLAIVEERIQQLGGSLDVQSQTGQGTVFIISLPVTIATFRGVLIQAASKVFIVPTTSTERVLFVRPDEIKSVEGIDTVFVDDIVIPICAMESALQLPLSHTTRKQGGTTDGGRP